MKPGSPSIPFPDGAALRALADELAAACRAEHSAWGQVDGFDEELGTGGICQDVASAMCAVLDAYGFEAMTVHSTVGENHVFVVALAADGVYSVDIPPSVYETGSGFTWLKRVDAVIDASCVMLDRIGDPVTPDEFRAAYAD